MCMQDLGELVRRYKETQQLEAMAAAELAALKQQLKAELAARGVARLDVGTHKVLCVPFTANRLDSTALKAAAPELAARFTLTTSGTRLVVA